MNRVHGFVGGDVTTDDIETIRLLNPGTEIFPIGSGRFARYGRLVTEYDLSGYIGYLALHTPVPDEGNIYVASDPAAETLPLKAELENVFYGGMPLEMGYCNGRNKVLNALEYHKGSELDVAATPSVLLLGSITDIRGGKINVDDLEAFYMEGGSAVELYATTLHFSPCEIGTDGFKMGIILPKGTNTPIDLGKRHDPTLWMRNKWLYAHPEAEKLISNGAYEGITGDMPVINHR